jgi:hypothetical protein
MVGLPGDVHAKGDMTPTHDRSLPGLDTANPPEVRGVLVSYHTFMERRGLLRRVVAALAKVDGSRAVALEGRAAEAGDKGKPPDVTS